MNSIGEVQTENRIVFMDRMRVGLVVLVILLHATGAYTNVLMWTVQDKPKSVLMDIMVFFLDGFLMPLLYFISGYFAHHALRKRSRWEFLVSKFRRVGLPFVTIALFLTPFITYVGVLNWMPNPPGFFNFWLPHVKSAADFTPLLFSTIEVASRHWMEYSCWHLWFVIVLLVFYILYAGYDFLKEKIHTVAPSRGKGAQIGIHFAMICAGALIIVFYSLANLVVPEWVWWKMGIFYLQPVRMPIYLVIFMFGAYSGSRKWFSNGVPGNTWIWGTAFVLFSAALIPCMFHVFRMWGKLSPYPFSLLHALIRTGVIISSLGFFMNYFTHRSAKKSPLDIMSGVSYEIYIIHLPVVIAIAKLFTMVTMSPLLKFVFVGVIATGTSYATGRYLIKPHPKTACAVIISVFALLCLVCR